MKIKSKKVYVKLRKAKYTIRRCDGQPCVEMTFTVVDKPKKKKRKRVIDASKSL